MIYTPFTNYETSTFDVSTTGSTPVNHTVKTFANNCLLTIDDYSITCGSLSGAEMTLYVSRSGAEDETIRTDTPILSVGTTYDYVAGHVLRVKSGDSLIVRIDGGNASQSDWRVQGEIAEYRIE